MEEKKGIKELMELLEAIEIVGVPAVRLAKNFSINLLISELVALGMKFDEIKDGIAAVKEIVGEVKDIDEEEAIAVIAKIYAVIKAIKAELAVEKEA